MHSPGRKSFFTVFLLLSTVAAAQTGTAMQAKSGPEANNKALAKSTAPAEDISGMYSFLREGEFVQINLEQNGVSGYISRHGDLESDRGAFLDQFFKKASVEDHYVTFITRPLHGVVFEFKGRFERGTAKSKISDGYYVLRGTLTEMISSGDKKTSRSREVAFKLLAQPPEESEGSKDKD
jgi:hypothetical protein